MPLNLPSRKQIFDGEISFISIDTNVILEEGRDFNKGRLNQVPNLVPHPIQLHLTDVTVREVARHFHDNAHQLRDALSRASRLLEQHGFDSNVLTDLRSQTSNLDLPHYLDYINKYVERCRGGILAVESHDLIDRVFDRYFDRRPPFSTPNKAKMEFPDAVSLLVLEDHALRKNSKAILVSKDKDWKEFIASSSVLYHVNTLDELFEYFQATGNLQSRFKVFAIDEINQEGTPWWNSMFYAVADHVITSAWKLSKQPESSWLRYESKAIAQYPKEFMVDESSVKLWPIADGCVLEVQVRVEVDLYVEFEQFERFEIEQGLHDWYPQQIEIEDATVSINVAAFVTFVGDIENPPANPTIHVDISRGEYEWIITSGKPTQFDLVDSNNS
ncbi:hypothetical protein AWB71_04297 [Caballeronia peredens]|nr:hypothetical protein AWB71_04297 [Caballeronia peredens]